MPKQNWKEAPPRVHRVIVGWFKNNTIEAGDGTVITAAGHGLLHAVSRAFVSDYDFPPDEVKAHSPFSAQLADVEKAGDAVLVRNFKRDHSIELDFEARALKLSESRREWAKGEPLGVVTARRVEEERAAVAKAELEAKATALVDAEVAAEREVRLEAARQRLTVDLTEAQPAEFEAVLEFGGESVANDDVAAEPERRLDEAHQELVAPEEPGVAPTGETAVDVEATPTVAIEPEVAIDAEPEVAIEPEVTAEPEKYVKKGRRHTTKEVTP
jgi:hypothetical protein